MGAVNRNSSHSPVGPWVCLCVFLGCMIYLNHVCFVLPWTVESFPFMLWRWRNKLEWAPFELFAPSPLLRVRSWLHPFKGHCEQQALRDEGVMYVAGHSLLNRRCTRLPGCICLRNDLYCVGWGVKLYSLTCNEASANVRKTVVGHICCMSDNCLSKLLQICFAEKCCCWFFGTVPFSCFKASLKLCGNITLNVLMCTLHSIIFSASDSIW